MDLRREKNALLDEISDLEGSLKKKDAEINTRKKDLKRFMESQKSTSSEEHGVILFFGSPQHFLLSPLKNALCFLALPYECEVVQLSLPNCERRYKTERSS